MLLTVDVVIMVNGTHAVFIKRAKPPFVDKLVLPGGHVEEGETTIEAAVREAEEELHLTLNPGQLKLLTVLDSLGRDPRPGRRVSVVFTYDVPIQALTGLSAGSDAASAELREIASLDEGELGFDHWEAVKLLRGGKP